MQSRRIEVSRAVWREVQTELAARCGWLRITLEPSPWWHFWRDPAVVITGPAHAVEAARAAIQRIEFEERWDMQW